MIGKFMRCTAAALCCLPAVSIAASDDLKELERVLGKVRSEPMIFVVVLGGPNACGRGCTEWIAGEGRFDEGAAQRFVLGRLGEARPADLLQLGWRLGAS
jgi:hypothetical protein